MNFRRPTNSSSASPQSNRYHYLNSFRTTNNISLHALAFVVIFLAASSSPSSSITSSFIDVIGISSSNLFASSFILRPTTPSASVRIIKSLTASSFAEAAPSSSTKSSVLSRRPLAFFSSRKSIISPSRLHDTATAASNDSKDSIIMTNEKEEEEGVPNIDTSTLQSLVEYAGSFSAANGLQVEVVASKSNDDDAINNNKSYSTAPISLLPQAYPTMQFTHAQSLAAPFNELVDRISRDGMFLKETLRDVRDVDVYTGKLLELYEEIYLGERKGTEWGKHARTADRLGIQRSDYMLHKSSSSSEEYSLKQVELNTIASSFAGLASTVANLHGFLTRRMEGELKSFLDENEVAVMGSKYHDKNDDLGDVGGGVPVSPAMERLPAAVSVAYDRYRERFAKKSDSSQLVVLFVVQPNETNTVDQRMFEFALWNEHKIPVVRMSLADIHDKITLDEDSGTLTFDNGKEVAVVYFRAGYAPTDYPSGYNTKDGSGIEWLARERLERGCAAKSPCLGYHLAGTKKVQQELARPGVVERFFPAEKDDTAARIRTAFAGLYSLGADANEHDLKAIKEVLFEEGGDGRYVLKPQREGGGYNYYGKDLAQKLQENCTVTALDDDDEEHTIDLSPDLSEFILMERLFPPQQLAILLRNGRVEGTGMTISELGCFGTIVASGDDVEGGVKVIHNEYAGFLLRTKFSGVDEGGVASGFATLSSPYLC